jgi:hypothetical protein
MREQISTFAASLAAAAAIPIALAQQQTSPDDWRATGGYLPEYTEDGDLVLSKTSTSGCLWDRR